MQSKRINLRDSGIHFGVAAVFDCVLAATPFVFKQVLLTTPTGSHGVVLRGVDIAREATVTEIARNLKAGTLEDLNRIAPANRDLAQKRDETPQSLPPLPGIIIGRELSLRLGAFLGDRINVVSPVGPISALGMIPKVRGFRVAGIFESGMFEYDSSLAYVSIQQAQEFFNMGHVVTGIEVKVSDIFAADEIAHRIDQTLLLRGFADALRGPNQLGSFASDALMKLGLLGTIVGFILMLAPIAGLDGADRVSVKNSMGLMSDGMAVAMYTTLTGLIGSVLLQMQYYLLDEATARVFGLATDLTEVFVVSVLEREHDGQLR